MSKIILLMHHPLTRFALVLTLAMAVPDACEWDDDDFRWSGRG